MADVMGCLVLPVDGWCHGMRRELHSPNSQWFIIAKNRDVSSDSVLDHLLIRSLVHSHCLRSTHSLALPCSLCLRTPLRSFVYSLAHSRARGKVNIKTAIFALFFPHLDHGAIESSRRHEWILYAVVTPPFDVTDVMLTWREGLEIKKIWIVIKK